MLAILNVFKKGFIIIFTSPFWLTRLLIKMVICLVFFFKTLFLATIYFFQGKSIFNSKEDQAIEYLKTQDEKDLDNRREEALDNVGD